MNYSIPHSTFLHLTPAGYKLDGFTTNPKAGKQKVHPLWHHLRSNLKDYLLPYRPYLIYIACPNGGHWPHCEGSPYSTVESSYILTRNWVVITWMSKG